MSGRSSNRFIEFGRYKLNRKVEGCFRGQDGKRWKSSGGGVGWPAEGLTFGRRSLVVWIHWCSEALVSTLMSSSPTKP